MPSLKFGNPFTGYVSSVLKHRVPPDKIGPDSQNVMFNPFDGSFYRRSGSTIQGDTISSGHEATGLLEQLMTSKCRMLGELSSPSYTDGYPVPSALLTDETNDVTFPTIDTGWFGTMYVRDLAGPGNYSWMSDYGGTRYPTAGGAGSLAHLVVPLWYESGEGGYTRGATTFTRRFLCPGSRSWLDAGNWRYLPSLRGTPARWNKRLKSTSVTAAEPLRVTPTGPFGPMYPPSIAAGSATAGSDVAWTAGDTFYYSVMFQLEDGSYSMPFIPRPKSTTLTSGLGFVTIGTIASGTKYADISWTKIPIGPDGTIARILLRSPKQNLLTTADPLTISYGDLQICGILKNNTQTSFTDTLGADAGLLTDDNIVRFDWVCPKRARSIGTGDQRAIIGYTLPSPCAIRVAPTGSASSRDLNLADTGSIVGATNFLVRVTSTQVELLKIAVGGTPNFAGGGNAVAFDYATYTTLQAIVDKINATTTASLCGEWAAALAPGVDGTTVSSSLCQTVISLTGCSASGTALTTASDTTVPLGYEVYDSAGKYAAGTYVQSRGSATGLVTSAAASGAINATQLFYCNTGDNCLAAGFVGYIRAFAPSMPAQLYFKRSAQIGYDTPDKRSIFFTVSSPGAAAIGVSMAANAWAVSNRRQPEGQSGNLLAITGIEDAAVLEYSRSRHLFVNRRGVTSGEDFDYRAVPINLRRGAIDSRSCVAVNNAAVCCTKHGIVAADKSMREIVLSNDVHNPGQNALSSLWTEIKLCLSGAQSDTDVGALVISHLGTQLHVCYRTSAVGNTNRRLVYDFSPGAEASGLAGLLSQDGAPFGWGAPATFGYSAMCEVSRDAGMVRYGWSDTNLGSTGDGRMDVFDDSTAGGKDNSTAYSALIYTSQVCPPEFKAIQAKRGRFMASLQTTAATIFLYRVRSRSSNSALLVPIGTDEYVNAILEYPQAARANGQCYEARVTLAEEGDVLWGHEVDYDLADQYLTL